MRPIYLDYNATTPIDPAVVTAMEPYLKEHFGNPSSSHVFGHPTHDAVERARESVADLLGASANEIVFTGGGSEANNMAIKGVIFSLLSTWPPDDIHVITSSIEHPATLEPCAFLERLGCKVTRLPVDRFGVVSLDALRSSLKRQTQLVSIMYANNEVGTIQPISEIAQVAHEHGAMVHTDAAQVVGKIGVDVNKLGIDLLSVAGHKMYAPKGIGVLYVRRGVSLEPLIHGAGHESGRRAGTENVPYIVALGVASQIAQKLLPDETFRLEKLRDLFWNELSKQLNDRLVLNGHSRLRLPNTLNVSITGCIGSDLLASVPDVAASTRSACHEGAVHLSPVLQAMGVTEAVGKGAIRLSVGRFTTEEEIRRAANLLAQHCLLGVGA